MSSTPGPYSVLVRDLVHRPGEMREKQLDVTAPDRIGTEVVGIPEGALVEIDGRFESLHDGILASLQVSAEADAECVRCLTEVRLPVDIDVQEIFAYQEDEAFDYLVENDHIDLEPAIRDAVVLELPFKPVCQVDCPGLCPQCGVRLLDNPGHEHEAPVDSRWAALSGLMAPDDSDEEKR